MFLKRIEVVYKNRTLHFNVGTPMEAVTEDVKMNPDPDKIVKNIELTENKLKVEYGSNEVTWLPLNNVLELHFKET